MANKSSTIVSVIIPVFNREKYLGRCLRSIIAQSFDSNSFEIIVIDEHFREKVKFGGQFSHICEVIQCIVKRLIERKEGAFRMI